MTHVQRCPPWPCPPAACLRAPTLQSAASLCARQQTCCGSGGVPSAAYAWPYEAGPQPPSTTDAPTHQHRTAARTRTHPCCRAALVPLPGVAAEGGAPEPLSARSSPGDAARVEELETELARVYQQLQEAEAHLVQAEASIRDEVVQEIQVGAGAGQVEGSVPR